VPLRRKTIIAWHRCIWQLSAAVEKRKRSMPGPKKEICGRKETNVPYACERSNRLLRKYTMQGVADVGSSHPDVFVVPPNTPVLFLFITLIPGSSSLLISSYHDPKPESLQAALYDFPASYR